LYLGIFVTGLAYLLFFEALKKIPAATGSMFFFMKPVIASVLAFLLLNEKLSLMQIIGILFVIESLTIDATVNFIRKIFSKKNGKVKRAKQ